MVDGLILGILRSFLLVFEDLFLWFYGAERSPGFSQWVHFASRSTRLSRKNKVFLQTTCFCFFLFF